MSFRLDRGEHRLRQRRQRCPHGRRPPDRVSDRAGWRSREPQGSRVERLGVGAAVDLTSLNPQQAAGTINSTPIPVADSGGLATANPLSSRTFGEAQLDLDFIFDEGECESFGSAFLKSRSSDSFTSQMKDFIAPVPVNITNCGKVIIRKQTNPDENPNATQFDYTKSFGTDPATSNTFQLADDGVQTYNGVLFGSGFTVEEGALPAGGTSRASTAPPAPVCRRSSQRERSRSPSTTRRTCSTARTRTAHAARSSWRRSPMTASARSASRPAR